jgi:hypothetical protein
MTVWLALICLWLSGFVAGLTAGIWAGRARGESRRSG